MRILSVNIGTTTVAFDKFMWTEKIYANGELMSKKFSVHGTKHRFEVEENGEIVKYILTTGGGGTGNKNRLTRNGAMIVESNCKNSYFMF